MKTHYSRTIGVASISSLVALAGCSSEDKKYKDWMETEGAANRINLDEVAKALDEAKGIADFENRVNEIYEGPHLVMIELKDLGNGKKVITGWEDVNNNKTLDTSTDFKLFSTTVGDGNYELRGSGVHHYYHHSGYYNPTGGFFLGYMMGSWHSPVYYTPATRYVEIRTYRNSYRSSPAYRSQKAKNKAYRRAQVKKHPKASKGFRSKVPRSRKSSKSFRTGS